MDFCNKHNLSRTTLDRLRHPEEHSTLSDRQFIVALQMILKEVEKMLKEKRTVKAILKTESNAKEQKVNVVTIHNVAIFVAAVVAFFSLVHNKSEASIILGVVILSIITCDMLQKDKEKLNRFEKLLYGAALVDEAVMGLAGTLLLFF